MAGGLFSAVAASAGVDSWPSNARRSRRVRGAGGGGKTVDGTTGGGVNGVGLVAAGAAFTVGTG